MVTNNKYRIVSARRVNAEHQVNLSRIRRWFDDSETVDGPPSTQTVSTSSNDAEWEAKYNQLQAELRKLNKDKAVLESSLAGAQGHSKNVTAKVKQLEAEKQSLAESLQAQLAELETSRDTLSSERETLAQQLQEAQSKLNLLQGRQTIRQRIPAEDQDLAALFVDTGVMDNLINVESDESFNEQWTSLKERIDNLVNNRARSRNAGSAPPAPTGSINRQTTNPADIADFLMGAEFNNNQNWEGNIDAYLDMLEKSNN